MMSPEAMSLDHVKETLDCVKFVSDLADQIKAKASDDGKVSKGEAVQIFIEMMGSTGEAIENIGDVGCEIQNMCEADAKHLGGEATAAVLKLCKAMAMLV